MTRLPVYFGYAGTVPFILIMLMSFFAEDNQMFSFLQMSYGTMILSFLGGVHWGQAIPTGNNKQLTFSMMPTIVCLALMLWVFLIDPFLPLLIMAGLFWAVYYADKKLMPPDYIPEGYFKYRLNLTIIVSSALLLTFLALL